MQKPGQMMCGMLAYNNAKGKIVVTLAQVKKLRVELAEGLTVAQAKQELGGISGNWMPLLLQTLARQQGLEIEPVLLDKNHPARHKAVICAKAKNLGQKGGVIISTCHQVKTLVAVKGGYVGLITEEKHCMAVRGEWIICSDTAEYMHVNDYAHWEEVYSAECIM
jgi:hypothetical protein